MNKFTTLTKQEMQEVNGGMWWCYMCPWRPGTPPHPPHPLDIGDIFGKPTIRTKEIRYTSMF